jgi:phytoene dehydrogenase-like protein
MSGTGRAIVIGAGPNGLTAATILARSGRRVLVLERRPGVGGLAAHEEFHPGYVASGLLHETASVRPWALEALGLGDLRRGAGPAPIFAPQLEGPGLLLHHAPAAAAAELRRLGHGEEIRYAAWRDFVGRIEPAFAAWCDHPPPRLFDQGLGGLMAVGRFGLPLRRLGRETMLALLRALPMPLADFLEERFDSEMLRSLLAGAALFGTFGGPRSPGTTLNLLRGETLSRGEVEGGARVLLAALERAARQAGVEIRTGSPAGEIVVEGRRARGVRLADGTMHEADLVAASCDPRTTLLDLLGAHHLDPDLAERARHLRDRGIWAKVDLALSRPLRFDCRTELAVVRARIAERLDDRERAFDAVKYGQVPQWPALDIHVPTEAHPDWAPPGHAVASIVVSCVPGAPEGGWDAARRSALGDAVVRALQRYVRGLSDSIVALRVLAPPDLASAYGVSGGHPAHLDMTLDQMLVRPLPACAGYLAPIEGLVLCGSGCHPGGGITCAPGALAARVAAGRRGD